MRGSWSVSEGCQGGGEPSQVFLASLCPSLIHGPLKGGALRIPPRIGAAFGGPPGLGPSFGFGPALTLCFEGLRFRRLKPGFPGFIAFRRLLRVFRSAGPRLGPAQHLLLPFAKARREG
jgi:hypothetical protein